MEYLSFYLYVYLSIYIYMKTLCRMWDLVQTKENLPKYRWGLDIPNGETDMNDMKLAQWNSQ